ncbi:hypothetical protein BASA81_002172 [Batrachochytrium salamandrivorans]|nr:hypothetical protein BASA81_002172 [Batrachochytrium salamandrivorans]
MFLQKRKITLPFGLSLTRVISLIIAVVYLISGLGSTTYWVLKAFGQEVEVPFGLSTFRALQWRELDFLLIFACFFAAASLFREERGLRGYLVGGGGFLSQGVLGFYVDSSQANRDSVGVTGPELQPLFLNVWFIVFGSLTLWLGLRGLDWVEKLDF